LFLHKQKNRLSEKRVVLITGASSGFGRTIASLLVEQGFTVFGTSRKNSSGKSDSFEIVKLDVNSYESVNSCVTRLVKRTERLDVLINNAAYSSIGAIEETSIQEAKAQFETNFFGVVRMSNAVLPIMRQQGSGQIINIGSISALIAIPFAGFYSASKSALEMYTEALRHEVKRLNIRASLVEPGLFRTNLGSSTQRTASSIDCYEQMRRRVTALGKEKKSNGLEPDLVAKTILQILRSRSPRLRYLVGKEKWYPRIRRITPETIFESLTRKYWELDS
jgi:short-subunit dehydrogenase